MGRVNGKKLTIDTLYAFLAVDEEDSTEGICSFQGPDGNHMPLIGADVDRMESLRPVAQMIADSTGLDIRLVHFTARTDIETVTPREGQ